MSDITIELIPNKPPLPINDDPDKGYGELKYIFYPGISPTQQIRLTNTTAGELTPLIYFDVDPSDSKWHKTLRITDEPDAYGVLAPDVLDTKWTGPIAAGGTQDLYVRSLCNKEGFSWKYEGSYWTNSGFVIADDDYINNNDEQTVAIDCDAAAVGATLTLDTLTSPQTNPDGEAFTRVKFSFDGAVNATFDIQYSDDNVTYTTVYTGADISARGHRYQMTFWWDRTDPHRYWRISKTNVATAGANITEVQWLLFEAHNDAYDYGVYGPHKALMKDTEGYMDDYTWKGEVSIATDTFSRQNYQKPIGRVGKRTEIMQRNFEKEGQTIQLYYIPTMTFSYNLNAYSDFQLEKRIWDVKCIITPQKRNLTYTAAADGLQPSLYRYDQRTILLEPYGPDKVGWYINNYDFWHAYGHSYYIILDDHCYKVDDPQPVYIDGEITAISARIFLQGDMTTLGTDPRNYILTNRYGWFTEFPSGGFALPNPTDWIDVTTPEQRTLVWSGLYPIAVHSRPLNYTNNPNPYSLTATDSPDDGFPNGEIWCVEEWNDPATTDFETSEPVVFGVRANLGTGNGVYFQMPRFYNWIGYVDYNGLVDPINWIVQLYYDEDCTIPVTANLEYVGTLAKVEYQYKFTLIAATGEVTLTALGNTISSDGHTVRTPSKLYVKYIAEDGQTAYYYP